MAKDRRQRAQDRRNDCIVDAVVCMSWAAVGDWLKENAGGSAALVGSLLTGNVPAAVAAGVSLVSGSAGSDDPTKVLEKLQTNPETLITLRRLSNDNEAAIRRHIETMTRLQLEDQQAAQKEAQTTIRAGDIAEDAFIRQTRPGQSWISLMAAIWYALQSNAPDGFILGLLLTLPFTYAGLRQVGKGIDSMVKIKQKVKKQ